MSLDQWASVAEIVASLAVIASLVYVAQQLKQNVSATRASSRHTIISTDVSLLEMQIAYPEIYAARYKDELSYEEKVRLENWLIELVRTREHQWLQYVDGMLDDKAWRSYLSGLSINLSYPRTRAWWNFVKQDFFDKQFASAVDQHLNTIPILTMRGSTFDIISGEPDLVSREFFETFSEGKP